MTLEVTELQSAETELGVVTADKERCGCRLANSAYLCDLDTTLRHW